MRRPTFSGSWRARARSAHQRGLERAALKHGDDLATRLIDGAVKALGTGIASAVNLLDPRSSAAGWGSIRRKVRQPDRDPMHPHLFVPDRPPHAHVATRDLGGAIGAALLVDARVAAAA